MPLDHEESGMGRRGYPPEFRRKVLDLIDADRSVADVARDLGISDQSIYTWRRQDRVDRGLVPDLTSTEKAELVAAKRRIAQLPAPLVGSSRCGRRSSRRGALRTTVTWRVACRPASVVRS